MAGASRITDGDHLLKAASDAAAGGAIVAADDFIEELHAPHEGIAGEGVSGIVVAKARVADRGIVTLVARSNDIRDAL